MTLRDLFKRSEKASPRELFSILFPQQAPGLKESEYLRAYTRSWVNACVRRIADQVSVAELKYSLSDDLRRSCEDGIGAACFALAELHRGGRGVSADAGASVPYYERACDRGITKGCFTLGMMLKKGEGVPQDSTKGDWPLRKACDARDMMACQALRRR